jgi:hypothetical protein
MRVGQTRLKSHRRDAHHLILASQTTTNARPHPAEAGHQQVGDFLIAFNPAFPLLVGSSLQPLIAHDNASIR